MLPRPLLWTRDWFPPPCWEQHQQKAPAAYGAAVAERAALLAQVMGPPQAVLHELTANMGHPHPNSRLFWEVTPSLKLPSGSVMFPLRLHHFLASAQSCFLLVPEVWVLNALPPEPPACSSPSQKLPPRSATQLLKPERPWVISETVPVCSVSRKVVFPEMP